MKRLFVLTATSLVFSLGSPLISLSAIPTNCDQQEEVFGFQIPTYATEHEGAPIINIQVTYRYMPEAIAKNDYPNFVPNQKSSAPRGGVWKSFARKPLVSIASLYFSPQGAGNYTHTRLKKISKHLSLIILITQIFGKSSIKN